MKNILALSILICLLSCNSEERTHDALQGFWWNGLSSAMYFNDSTCIAQGGNFKVSNFEIISDNKLAFYQNNEKIAIQEFRFNNDTLGTCLKTHC